MHYDFTPYNYVLNNPVNNLDVMGLDTLKANKVTPADWHNFNTSADVVQLNEVKIAPNPASQSIETFLTDMLTSWQSKDGDIGSGFTFYNNSNTTRADLDNDKKPNAKETTNLGDMSDFFALLGSFRTTPGANRFTDDAALLGVVSNLNLGEVKHKKSVETNLLIDSEKLDTVTAKTISDRVNSGYNKKYSNYHGTILFRNYDNTLTTVPKVDPNP